MLACDSSSSLAFLFDCSPDKAHLAKGWGNKAVFSQKYMHLSFKTPAMWTDFYFNTGTESQVAPCAAPGKPK